jgi:hypothetical protein
MASFTTPLLKQRILSNYPQADEETLLDTLEGITDLHEMIAAVIRSALVDEALQVGLRSRLKQRASEESRAHWRSKAASQLSGRCLKCRVLCPVGHLLQRSTRVCLHSVSRNAFDQRS